MEATTGLDTLTRALIDEAPRGFVVVTLDGRITYWNRQAQQVLGWSAQQVLGRIDPTVMSDQDLQATLDTLASVAAGGAGPTGRLLHRRAPDGSVVDIVIDAWVPLGTPVNEIGLWFGPHVPTDAARVWRETLSRELVQALTLEDVASVVSIGLDQLLGADAHATVFTPMGGTALRPRLAIGSDRGDPLPLLALEEGGGQPWERALGGVPAGGRLVGRDALFLPMGPPEHPWVFAVELHPRRHRDVQLLTALRSLSHETWLAVQRAELVSDLEGQLEILTAVTAVAGVAGVDLDALVSAVARLSVAFLDADRVGIYLLGDDQTVQAAHPPSPTDRGLGVGERACRLRPEITVLDPAGGDVDAPWRAQDGVVDLLVSPLRVGGTNIGSLVVARTGEAGPFSQQTRQVTAALSQQAALAAGHARLFEREQATVQRLRELDQMKADYVAGVSHDLKSPLTSMLGFASTLRRHGDDLPREDRARYLGAIERQARRMVSMAEDLVLAARMDHGHVEPDRTDAMAPAELLLEAVEGLDPQRRTRVHLVDVAAGGVLHGDRPQLLRVLTNLLDNALKYGGDAETIDVSVRIEEGHALVVVRDRGPGVPPGDREAIFDRYRRGSEGTVRGSTGLGLYISRGIARGHGGDLVVVDPATGPGAEFRLTLPIDVTPQQLGTD